MFTLRAGPTLTGELIRAPDASVIVLTLNEQAAEQNVWRIRLIAELGDGSHGHVGQLLTRSQFAAAGRPSRVIGVACCPGAVAWHLEARLLGSSAPRGSAELGAAVAPGAVTRAEVVPNEPHAYTRVYWPVGGVGAPVPGTDLVVGAGEHVLAITGTRAATALTNGTINVSGQLLQVPPGTSLTLEPEGLWGPVTITFTDLEGYAVELEA